MIHEIMEAKKKRLSREPDDSWYGDTFDFLYDKPSTALETVLLVKAFAKANS